MTDWIDLGAVWRIVVLGLLFGAGLPALFGLGLRVLTPGRQGEAGAAAANDGRAINAHPAALALAGACFAVVLAAVGWGIYLIVAGA